MTTLEQRVNPDPVVVAGFIGGLLRGWQWVAGTGTGVGTGGETTAHSAQNVPAAPSSQVSDRKRVSTQAAPDHSPDPQCTIIVLCLKPRQVLNFLF